MGGSAAASSPSRRARCARSTEEWSRRLAQHPVIFSRRANATIDAVNAAATRLCLTMFCACGVRTGLDVAGRTDASASTDGSLEAETGDAGDSLLRAGGCVGCGVGVRVGLAAGLAANRAASAGAHRERLRAIERGARGAFACVAAHLGGGAVAGLVLLVDRRVAATGATRVALVDDDAVARLRARLIVITRADRRRRAGASHATHGKQEPSGRAHTKRVSLRRRLQALEVRAT